MLKLILIVAIICIVYYCYTNKIKIKFKTFFKRGFKVQKGVYGIYTYVGFQGDGKSYSCVEYVIDNYSKLVIFSNITLFNVDYIHYVGFEDMLKLRDLIDYAKSRKNDYIIWNGKKVPIDWEKQIIFIYDEIFSELQRGSKISTDVLDFITQMRKRHFILLTTAQIWSDIPLTWRRLTRFQIDCSLKCFFGLNLLIKVVRDAEHMRWDNLEQDFIAPIVSTTITHTRKFIANSYDTFEVIHNKSSNFNKLLIESSSEVSPKTSEVEEKKDSIDFNFWKDIVNDEVIYEEEN